MVDFKQVPPDSSWDKKVRKIAAAYNELARKIEEKPGTKKFHEKMDDLIEKLEEAIITERNTNVKRDYAFLIQLIAARHDQALFSKEILQLQDHMMGGSGGDGTLAFQEAGTSPPPQQEQFNIETIDLEQIDLLNLERINAEDLEKSSQKCAFGDGEILDEKGNPYGNIWRCKGCKTVYHENCLRLTLLVKGSCQVCDEPYLQEQQPEE